MGCSLGSRKFPIPTFLQSVGCFISVGSFCSQRHSFSFEQPSCLCPNPMLDLTNSVAWVHDVRSPDAYSGTEERQRYYTNPFETSALEWNGDQLPRRGDFTPAQTRYPFYRRLTELQSWCGKALKNFSSIGFDTRTTQPIASCYSSHRCMVYSN